MAKTHIKNSQRAKTLCGLSSSKVELAETKEMATCKVCSRKYKEIKNGRPNKITPDDLFKAYEQYKVFTKNDPYIKKDFKGKDADEVIYEIEKPLLWVGFKVYCFRKNIYSNVDKIAANKDGQYDKFVSVIEMIRADIALDQLGGAGAGVYNGNVIGKLQNLVERTKVDTTVTEKITKIGYIDDEKPDKK